MPLPDWLINSIEEKQFWWAEIFTVVCLTLLISFLINIGIGRLYKKAKITQSPWDDALLGSIKPPMRALLLLIGLSWAADIASIQAESALFEYIEPIRRVGIIVMLTWFLIRFIKRAEANLLNPDFTKKPMDETTVAAMAKLLRISVFITSTLIMMQSLGYSISGVLAFGGIGGIAVGFAAKDLLANFFGGLMIYLDRPFNVGDWIRSPDKEIEGTVEDIGWRLTRIRTFDKRPLYVPNATFTQISVENPSRMTNRRIYETIGIRYCDAQSMPTIVAKVKTYLQNNSDIDESQTMIVNFSTFASSSLNFFIYTFTKTTNWIEYHRIKQDVLLNILTIVESEGAQFAFPTSTLHIDSLPSNGSSGGEVFQPEAHEHEL